MATPEATAATPQITLTATLQDQTGKPIPKAQLIITLCGYGQVLPCIIGTTMLAKVGPLEYTLTAGDTSAWTTIDGTSGGPGIPLWGNDAIFPSNTFYSVAVADAKKNIVQCGIYQFTGSGEMDLSGVSQLPTAPGTPLFADDQPLSGTINGINAAFSLPQSPQPQSSVQLYKNGVLQKQGTDYTMQGFFVIYKPVSIPQPGDTHVAYFRFIGTSAAFQQVPNFADGEVPAGAIDGNNKAFSFAHIPNPPACLQFFYNGTLFNQGVDYLLSGNLLTYLNFAPMIGDTHEAFYRY